MNAATCAVFFCSGAAALLFETLWFRQAGLVLGNTVWASALVTAAFMAGLALGNGFAIRLGWRLTRPLRVFALLELIVGVTGAGLVLLLPRLIGLLAPVMARLQGTAAIDAARLLITFALLVGPATAMGATLPILARSLGARDPNFGRLMGRLYGWNTLGAVAGALVGEWFLIRLLGVAGTGGAAAGLDFLAAFGAWLLDRRQPAIPEAPPVESRRTSRSSGLGAAAFLSGALLLALEVVWFRFLLMFTWATTGTFAVMLAIVLLGIGTGGLLASFWLGRRPDDARHVGLLGVAAGVATIAGYGYFDGVLPPASPALLDLPGTLRVALWLMLPVCTLSGALFTFLGHGLRAEEGEASRAAGLLTLANTVGAMLGSLLAGFVFIPFVGIENSIFVLACGYGAVAALASPPPWRPRMAALGVLVVALLLFPFGAMYGRHFRYIESAWSTGGYGLRAVKEGLTETVFLLRKDSLNRPVSWRLLTNGMGMSTTDYRARRYMGQFVWLPVALHKAPRSALVISYGLGNTARALVATSELTRIDIVDVSVGVLNMAPLVWSGPLQNPLRDPRVQVHVEDGRFFLLTSRERFDIITGEPPPPKSAGIGALYSREYFALMRERLAEGGIASYWLPVLGLDPRETLAVARGFCDVFDDCSLWTGFGHEWLLLGTRAARGPGSAARFARQWNEPAVLASLKAAGFASPAQMGATFLADAAQIGALTREIAPLVDNHPYRLDPRRILAHPSPEYAQMMDTGRTRDRFQESAFIRRVWPAEWIEPTLSAFAAQAVLNRHSWSTENVTPQNDLSNLEAALAAGDETLALWTLGTSVEEQELAAQAKAQGFDGPELLEISGLAALAQRRYADAERLLAGAEPYAAHGARLRRWRILAAELAADHDKATQLLASAGAQVRASTGVDDREAWAWLAHRLAAPLPVN